MLQSYLCDFSDAYIVVKATITVADPNNYAYDKKLASTKNALFVLAFQKIMIHLLTMQKI